MGFQIKSFDKLVEDMVSWIVANNPNISDLSPGSVIRSYCEGAGLCLEELYVSTYLGFRRYLESIQETVFDFERKEGTKASTNVIFTRTVPNVSSVLIPVGTIVKTPSGLEFETTAPATIPSNLPNSNPVEALAMSVGVNYNVQASSITIMGTTVEGVDSVNNGNAATGGVDRETDYQYKNRFQNYIEGLGRSNIAGLVAGGLSVPGITSVSVQELFPPVGNVNVRLYVDDGSISGVSVAKVAEVQAVIDGDGTQENPGYRAAGVNVQALAPGVVVQNITATIEVLSGIDTDQTIIDINQGIIDYVNNLGVGANIIRNELIFAIMNVFGVTDCVISLPAANVPIASSQVGRTGIVTVVVV